MVTPAILPALAGGALIGISASALLVLSGRIAGISGIVAGLVGSTPKSDIYWRIAFVAGLLAGGLACLAFRPSVFDSAPRGPALLVVAGLLVGVGTTLGRGCTSGHGVCGMSRFASRSIVATGVFMATGMLTTFFMSAR